MTFKRIRKDGKLALIELMIEHYPNNSWSIEYENNDKENGKEILIWNDTNTPEPSKETINDLYDKMQSEWMNIQYRQLRAPEYPSIGDQLDALFHAGVFPPEMAAKIQAIKDKYPKP